MPRLASCGKELFDGEEGAIALLRVTRQNHRTPNNKVIGSKVYAFQVALDAA